MSEKRFIYEEEHYNFPVKKRIRDTQNNETYDLKKCCGLLNEQQATIEELRLQEKEKGVPVFVVRDGKNPVALFFNEQRASLYCQENMANLTYQQEKWCRVE